MMLSLFHSGASRPRRRAVFGGTQPRLAIAAIAAALAFLTVDAALAHGFRIGAIAIGHPWSRATPPGAKVGGGYLKITNEGDTPDRLVAASFADAERAELHEMKVVDGVMKMSPVEGGLEIPAGGSVTLAPAGYHLMFIGLKQPLVKDSKVKGTLTFEKAGTVAVEFAIDAIGATGKAGGQGGTGDMPGMTH